MYPSTKAVGCAIEIKTTTTAESSRHPPTLTTSCDNLVKVNMTIAYFLSSFQFLYNKQISPI
jgi:hypothetical protein